MKIIKTHKINISDLPDWEKDQVYNGLDICATHEIFGKTSQQLDNHSTATYNFSRALQAPVLDMMHRGVLIDQARKEKVLEDYATISDKLQRQLESIVLEGVGMPSFNWRSPTDLRSLFYDRLGLPIQRKQGRPTADRAAREKLLVYQTAEPILNHINILADLEKKMQVLRTGIDATGRIHTSYNIAGTSTGRFSSSASEFGDGTNLQNIEESLRSIFIADKGMKFAKCDAKSGESFCVGAIEWNRFHDGRYLDVCETGDPHTAVARICWPALGWTGEIDKDKSHAERPYYRHYTYRFMCKKLGHGCLTGDHEVLTPSGWASITEKPGTIMTWVDGRSEFQQVESWTDFQYTGQLQSFEGNSISLLATHDHRIPYKKDLRYPLCETAAVNGPQSKMPLGSGWVGSTEEVPARLIAAFMCDGYLDEYNITWHFSKERKVFRLIELLQFEDIEYNHYINSDGTYKITIKRFDWPKHPGPFMFNWTEECISDFIDELKWWDGYHSPTSISITSTRRDDLEWYQTFGRIIGIGGQIQKPQISGFGSTIYRLQQNNRQWAAGPSVAWAKIYVWNERVLCPTVTNSWFYVRRNGKIFVTGNSNYGGRPETLAEQTRVPIQLVREFQPKYFHAFPAHEQWHEDVDLKLRKDGHLISLMGRKRWFFGRRDSPDIYREALAYDPQSSLADIVNTAMLRIWRQGYVIVAMHDHDALTFMYPEEIEDEILPKIMSDLVISVPLEHGRELRIPYDCAVGWNKGKYHEQDNPNGLKEYLGRDNRTRQAEAGILDRIVYKRNRRN